MFLFSHTFFSFLLPELRFSTYLTKYMIAIITKAIITEIADPKFHSPTVINWFSITLPIKKYWPPPNNLGMKNELTAGKKTSAIPLITPGIESGKVTFEKVW